ncbi:MAG: polyprenol phosphomannose-dependent alpha 1,6 mannosyltransferase MptB [Chloroflexi bacterium]|nr:polyprenol phosphomannose-dependent alpha 1,6 mannosyltransferase MptB [Chloroflexota bacterium]
MVFLGAAVGTVLLYAVWVVWVPLLPTNLYIPLLDLGKITGYTWASAGLYLALVLLLFALYAVGYRAITSGKSRVKTWWLFAAGAILCAELVWAYPATAVDVFGYVASGQILGLHQANPFVVLPSAFPGDAILAYVAYPDEPSQYGPVWVLLSGAVAALTRTDLPSEVLMYKVVAAAAQLASAGAIYHIALRLTASGRMAQASAFLFLWNPLLLWEMVANAHNDGFMMLLGLVGVWLFVAGHDLFALLAIAAGALVKAPVALIGPVVFAGAARRNCPRAVEGALLGLLLAAVVYRPFWEGPQTLTALQRADLFTASLGAVLRLALAPALGLGDAGAFASTVSLSAFTAIVVMSVMLAFRAQTDVERLRPAYYTLLAALLLLTTWFQAWYVVWPFALGAALAEPRRHLEVALLSLGGLLQYFVFIYLWVMGFFPRTENLGVQLTAYLVIVGPLLVMLIVRAAPRVHLPIPRRLSQTRPSAEYH